MSIQVRQRRVLSLLKHLGFSDRTFPTLGKIDRRLQNVGTLPRGFHFSGFNKEHTEEAEKLYRIFHAANDFEDFMHLAKQARYIVNEALFFYSFSAALLHRDDCRGLLLPPIQEAFPARFVPCETINQAIKADYNRTDDKPIIVEVVQTGNILDPEYQLAYFREDFAANAHHWNWHVLYPSSRNPEAMGREKDRKGELFYYMHQQMCARYDIDRLSVGLPRAIPFHNFNEVLYGYSPHLTLLSGQEYSNRPSGLSLVDVKGKATVQDIIRWRERILEAIDLGVVIDKNGNEIVLTPEKGINILGAMVEASYESVNEKYYGNIHNQMHNLISLIIDPDGRFKLKDGVMGDLSTALRDPIFYRLHRFLDDIFQEYKATLPVYDKKDLDFPGVSIVNVTINGKVPNIVNTYMKEDLLELSHAIPMKGEVKVKYQHLDHEPFTYHINCENNAGGPKQATVRIFLAPVYDELGNKFSLKEVRNYFIELDKFRAELVPGKNTISRESRESSVTGKLLPSFKELYASESLPEEYSDFCHCGWPDHLLLPRGNYKGMDFYLFVMLTDYEQDKVEGPTRTRICADSISYCGVKDEKYPDKKAMGFPFDRTIEALTIPEFSTPNMIFQNVKIQFKE